MRIAIALLACLALDALADDATFPQGKPIEITCLFPAGSSADVTARMLADGMSKALNQRVLVIDKPGAGGAIGYKFVAGQKPDGYALVWNSNSISTTHHSGQLDIDYRAFDPVARVLVESPVVAVRADARWKTLADLIADAKTHPKQISVGHSGVGSHTHLVLAALTPARDPALPDVPTAREQGVDVALEAWRGIAVPHGTPKAVIAALEAAIRKAVESPEFAKESETLNVRPAFMPADEFGALMAREDGEIAATMKAIGIATQ